MPTAVVNSPFKPAERHAELAVNLAGTVAVIDSPSLPPVIQDDPSEDRFLECAVAGKADCIISGDKHLLKLVEFQGIPILKPAAFLKRYL